MPYNPDVKIGALRLKLQLLCGDGYALGPGRADLLDAIARTGSISAAGRDLGMSYRRAWLLVDDMNRTFALPLVDTIQGGGHQRGARLSPTGIDVLAAYRELEEASASIMEHPAYHRLLTVLRDAPLPDPEPTLPDQTT